MAIGVVVFVNSSVPNPGPVSSVIVCAVENTLAMSNRIVFTVPVGACVEIGPGDGRSQRALRV